MSKHTQGPWTVHRGEICYTSKEDDQSFGMQCPVDLGDKGNMRIIAASPELLEALLEFDDAFHNLDLDCRESRVRMRTAVSRARAAIAKAT